MTQTMQLIEHFRAGNTLTSAEAIVRFSCERLAARISELRQADWKIRGARVKCHDGNRRVVYRLSYEQTVAGEKLARELSETRKLAALAFSY